MKFLNLSRAGVILLVASAYVLSACDSGNAPGPGPVPNVITGIVSAPSADSSQFIAGVRIFNPLTSLAAGFTATANADVAGLVPVGGATVQLVRLNNLGAVSSVIATTTSSGGGGYVFTDTPTPDSTLAVRVTGQSAVMRAIVTGSEINVSPASEAVVDSIIDGLSGGVTLADFEVGEVSAMANLVAGMDVDLDGLTFTQAVTALQNASSPVLAGLVSGFSGSGVATVLYNNLYGGLQFESALKDTFTLGAGAGGIEIRTLGGGWGYGDSSMVSGGSIFGTLTRHNLTTVEDPDSDLVSVGGTAHAVTADGQVVVTDTENRSTVGAVTADGSLMVYPVETTDTGVLGRGLMLAVKRTVNTTTLDNTVLDATGGSDTVYNLVRLKETFSGLQSEIGQNLAALTTETGSLSFDSDDQFVSGENVYAALSADVTSANRLALDLDSEDILQSNPAVDDINGRYLVILDGSVILQNSDGTSLGQGYVTSDGDVLALSTSTDLILIELDVLANDSDPDVGDSLTIAGVNSPTLLGGTVTVNAAGNRLLYIPPNNVNAGTEEITYSVSDGTTTSVGTVQFEFTSSNTTPVANPDSFSVAEDSSNNELDVLANDTDDDIGTTLTITAGGTPSDGGTVISNGSRLFYTPAAAHSGPETFTYTVSDGTAAAQATVTVLTTLASIGNSVPAAVDDSGINVAMGSANNLIDVLANDTDADVGDTLTISAVGTPSAGGTATVVQDIGGNDLLSYTPLSGYSGTETISYTVSDSTGTDTATATITVVGVGNTAPTAEDDSDINVAQGSSNNGIDVLANDHDDDVGDTLTITQVSATSGAGGTVINGVSSVTYTPPTPTYTGLDTFTYTATDGVATDTATVTLTVVAAPYTAPVAADDADFRVDENSSGNLLDVLANDSDADVGDTVTISNYDTTSTEGGTVAISGNLLSYTPAANFSGTDTFDYTASDGALSDTATVTIAVLPANTAPAANDDSIDITQDSSNNALAVLANDVDADVGDILTITAATITTPLGGGGSLGINGGNDGLIYAPAAGATGTEVLSYTISDGTTTDTATVTVAVGNAAPLAVDDGFNVAAVLAGNILDVLVNDTDTDVPIQTLTISAADATSVQGGTIVNNGTSLTYTPAAGFASPDSFSYTVSDGITTDTATVTVTVGANVAPDAADDAVTVLEDSSGNALDVLANDSDVDVPSQTLAITAASVTTPLGAGGTVTINGTNDGLLYTPVAAATGTEVISYTVSDGTDTDTATVTVTVEANLAPTPAADSFSVGRNSSANTLDVLANDSDPNATAQTLTITAASVTTPLGGGGSVSVNGSNDRLVYTPPANASGTEVLSYTVDDGTGDTAVGTVTITVVAPSNTAPVALDDDNTLNTTGFNVAMGSSNNPLDVLANDSDADVGDTLTITAVDSPTPGGATVTINGGSSLRYTPQAGFNGSDTFSYTISDGTTTATADVTVTVLGIDNTPPNAVNDSVNIYVRAGSTGNLLDMVLDNDTDPDLGDALTITAASINIASPLLGSGGSVSVNGTNDALLYDAPPAATGIETLNYTISDGTASDSGIVTLTVIAANGNNAPAANNDTGYRVQLGSSNNELAPLANDDDFDVGDELTITVVDTVSTGGGTVTINGSAPGNTVLYTPPANFSGNDTFTYTVSDGTATDSATVTVAVIAGNTPPIAVNDTGYRVAVNSSNNALAVLANDSDADTGDTLTITQVGAASAGGTVTINGSNTGLIYTPAASYSGTESFTYTISDGSSTDQATVTVTVTASNTPPLTGADTSWTYVVPSETARTTNLANREVGVAIRRASGLGNGILNGTYNVVQHAGYFTTGGAGAAAEAGYKYGTVTFNGSGGVSSGNLLGKRASLDIDGARSGNATALTTLESSTESVSGGSYSVASSGTLTLTLNSAGTSLTGTGAVSSDGEVVALAIRVTEGGDDAGRGLLFLVRQP